MARAIDIKLPGGVILLTPPGVLPARLVHSHGHLCNATALQRIRRYTPALAELRREWRLLGLPYDPQRAPMATLLATLEDAVRRRRLDLHWLPHDTGSQPTQRAQLRAARPRSVREWSWHEKIAAALQRALTAKAMKHELQGLMRQLLDPQNLIYAIPLIAAMAVPGGGAVMAAFAYAAAGWAGLMAMIDFGKATIQCVQATSEAEIDAAAEYYAKAIVALGAAVLSRFIARLGVRGVTSSKGAPPRARPGASGGRPQPAPAARTRTQTPPANTGPAKRPTWRQSELDAEQRMGPGYSSQTSYKNGKVVPYGTKGSTRPDLYKPGESIDVKNYKVGTAEERARLVANAGDQARDRALHLPPNTTQKLIVDVRGQTLSRVDAAALQKAISTRSGGLIKPGDVTIHR